ncbi:MAG: F0F1 ATP synthase subunit epsilon [Alphaproteobacteria bacterium]
MADKIEFELVSPERLILSEPVDMVVVPGTEGNFGALPGHAPFASTVRADVIEVYEGNTVRERIFVAGGFAEVTPDRVTVLADEAINLDRLDRAAVEQSIRALEQEIGDSDTEAERAPLAARLAIEQAKIAALTRAGKA